MWQTKQAAVWPILWHRFRAGPPARQDQNIVDGDVRSKCCETVFTVSIGCIFYHVFFSALLAHRRWVHIQGQIPSHWCTWYRVFLAHWTNTHIHLLGYDFYSPSPFLIDMRSWDRSYLLFFLFGYGYVGLVYLSGSQRVHHRLGGLSLKQSFIMPLNTKFQVYHSINPLNHK